MEFYLKPPQIPKWVRQKDLSELQNILKWDQVQLLDWQEHLLKCKVFLLPLFMPVFKNFGICLYGIPNKLKLISF